MKTYRNLIILLLFIIAVAVVYYLDVMPFGVPEHVEHRWKTDWANLNLPAVKRAYQPYTVAQMNDLWYPQLLTKYGHSEAFVDMMRDLDKEYPADFFLTRMLALGNPFIAYSDYEKALTEQRRYLYSVRLYWNILDISERRAYVSHRGLPPDAAWEVLEADILKSEVINSLNYWHSVELDTTLDRPKAAD